MPKKKNVLIEAVEKVGEAIEGIVEESEEAAKNLVNGVENLIEGKEKKSKPKNKESKELKKEKKEEVILNLETKVFDLYDIAEVQINDPGLKNAINLEFRLVTKSHGRNRERFGRSQVNIIERLASLVGVPGHRGKKHKIVTRWASGKYNKNMKMVLEAFKIINEKTQKNPVQVLVTAIENSSPKDEVTMIQYGGARYPQAVDCSPLRRVSLSLRNIVHGAYDKSFRSKKLFSQALAEEIIATANNDNSSVAVTKRIELEKQADAAR
jgi:small subunit ribosomal protein S7